MLKETLEKNPQLKKDLFIRGFLLTDDSTIDEKEFPFYGLWNHKVIENKYHFWTHQLTGFNYIEHEKGIFFIFGHAYNPYTMEISEENILKRIADSYEEGSISEKKVFFEKLNEITGVYVLGCIVNGRVEYVVDPSGMQSACTATIDGKLYVSSHPQLIGDIKKLTMDDFVKELIQYKWYPRVMGAYLPTDLTPFKEVKRIVPNSWYVSANKTTKHRRFWPVEEQQLATEKEDYDKVIRESADILHKNMELISKKWKHPWISLTGGIDSNTTFAAANGNYDKFETFSYISAEKEIRDAEAAKTIAEKFNVKHHEYHIPDDNEEVKNFDEIMEVFDHNNGYIVIRKPNEYRKRIFLRENLECDVEVKSWVSETIRGYWYKHYGRTDMPELSPKLYRNLYKIFTTNRNLAHRIDKMFEQFIKDYQFDIIPDCYPTAEMHYNDVTWGSWGGLGISEMKYYTDITFAYNNRNFLNLMFKVPLQKRIDDIHHLDMKEYLNKELFDMGIRVVNMKETDFRASALNTLFKANTLLP